MKDQAYILALVLNGMTDNQIKDVFNYMIDNDWIVIAFGYGVKYDVKIYENEDCYNIKEFMCKGRGESFNIAFVECLRKLQDYYIRVS